jgi:hypothetical protein
MTKYKMDRPTSKIMEITGLTYTLFLMYTMGRTWPILTYIWIIYSIRVEVQDKAVIKALRVSTYQAECSHDLYRKYYI